MSGSSALETQCANAQIFRRSLKPNCRCSAFMPYSRARPPKQFSLSGRQFSRPYFDGVIDVAADAPAILNFCNKSRTLRQHRPPCHAPCTRTNESSSALCCFFKSASLIFKSSATVEYESGGLLLPGALRTPPSGRKPLGLN